MIFLKKTFLLVFTILFCQNSLFAQNKVFVARFEHQTNSPAAFPNYFQSKEWTDSLLSLTKNWAKENLKAVLVDYKKKNPINYIPALMISSEIKSIGNTDYDLAVSIVSTIESDLGSSRNPQKPHYLRFELEVYDKSQRKVMKQKTKTEFVITEHRAFYAEVKINQEDFQKMYLSALRATLGLSYTEKFVFQQPKDELIEDLMADGEKSTLRMLNRGAFECINSKGRQELTLKLNTPTNQADIYERSANFLNPYNQINYQLKASLNGENSRRVQVDFFNKEKNLGSLKYYESLEDNQIIGKIGEDKIELIRRRSNDLVKIRRNNQLIAVLHYRGGKFDQNVQYDMYSPKLLISQQQAQIFNILLGELLIQAVQKYFEIETKGLRKPKRQE